MNYIPSFLSQNTDDYECSICLDIFIKPKIFNPCGHSFCQECGKGIKKCPLCRKSVKSKINDLTLQSIINKLEGECEECGWNGSFLDFQDHLKNKHNFNSSKRFSKKSNYLKYGLYCLVGLSFGYLIYKNSKNIEPIIPVLDNMEDMNRFMSNYGI